MSNPHQKSIHTLVLSLTPDPKTAFPHREQHPHRPTLQTEIGPQKDIKTWLTHAHLVGNATKTHILFPDLEYSIYCMPI